MGDDENVYYRAKSFVVSRTLIINLLAGVVALLAEPTYVAVLPKQVLPIIAIVLPPLNMILRFYSTRPVAMFDSDGSVLKPKESRPVAVQKLD